MLPAIYCILTEVKDETGSVRARNLNGLRLDFCTSLRTWTHSKNLFVKKLKNKIIKT